MKINFHKRENRGTRSATALRDKGFIPAVCYGAGEENMSVAVEYKDMVLIMKSDNVVIETEGAVPNKQVLIQSLERDPVTMDVVHVDFLFVDARHEVEHEVPIHIEGEAPVVKFHGGQVVVALRSVLIRALPQNLPSSLVVDISELEEVGAQILAKDVKLPSNVELVTDPESIIVSAVEAAKEEEVVEEPIDMADIEASGEGPRKEEKDEEVSE